MPKKVLCARPASNRRTFETMLWCSLSMGAIAQVDPTQIQDALRRNELELIRRQQQEQQQRQQQERAPDVRLQAAPLAEKTLPEEVPCFAIKRVQIDSLGGDVLPELADMLGAITTPELSPVIGQCVGVQGLGWLVEQAQNILLAQGYITSRVMVPQQDISAGVIHLTLIPGKIHSIRYAAPVPTHNKLDAALALRVGEVLNLRDIEQTLENLKRVPTAEANIQIEPAGGESTALGESDVVVTYQQAYPLRLLVSADDSGTQATGKYQGSVTVSLDNPMGWSDLFYVTQTKALGGGDSGPRGTRATQLHYSLPIGYWTLGMNASESMYYQTVAGLNQSYVYRGSSENKDVKISRLVYRDSMQKANVAFRMFQRKSNNYIDDTEVNVQRRVVGGWDSTLGYKVYLQSTTVDTNLTYKRGTGAFGALPAPEEAFNDGSSRFALIAADLSVGWTFKIGEERLRYDSVWRGQQHKTPLTAQDRFILGGRYTIRGFDGESVLSAESGWLTRNEMSIALGGSGHEAYVGIDTGQVTGPSSGRLVGNRLTGAVMGLRGHVNQVNYELFIAAPVKKPEQFKTAGSTAGFNLSLGF